MKIVEIASLEEAEKLVNTSSEPLVLDFYKDNCGRCKALDALLKKLQSKPEVQGTVYKVKLEVVGEDFFFGYDVHSTPTLLRIENDTVVNNRNAPLTSKTVQELL